MPRFFPRPPPPLNVLDLILDALNPKVAEDHATVATCALACRAWAAHIRVRKFRRLRLHPQSQRLIHFQREHRRRVNVFCHFSQLLRAFPAISDVVEDLHIHGGCADHPFSQADEGIILEIVARLPRLRVLEIKDVPPLWPVPVPDGDQHMKDFSDNVHAIGAGTNWRRTQKTTMEKILGCFPPQLRLLYIENVYFLSDVPKDRASGERATSHFKAAGNRHVYQEDLAIHRICAPDAKNPTVWMLYKRLAVNHAPLVFLECTWGSQAWNNVDVLGELISNVAGTLKDLALRLPREQDLDPNHRENLADLFTSLKPLTSAIKTCARLTTLTLRVDWYTSLEENFASIVAPLVWGACLVILHSLSTRPGALGRHFQTVRLAFRPALWTAADVSGLLATGVYTSELVRKLDARIGAFHGLKRFVLQFACEEEKPAGDVARWPPKLLDATKYFPCADAAGKLNLEMQWGYPRPDAQRAYHC